MKTKLSRRILSLLLMLCMVCTMLPGAVFAEQAAQEPETESAVVTETEPVTVTETVPVTVTETEPVTVTETEPVAVTEAGPEEPETPTQEPMGEVEVTVVSRTSNIVGEVFANAFNELREDPEQREAYLQAYPTECHEASYYEGTLRLRFLQDEDDAEKNYLVYRDSFLIFSEKDSQGYQVRRSEDGTTAYVSPAIPADLLKDRTGLVFLGENITCDDILVFGGEWFYDGEELVVPLKNTEDIFLTEVFSDGEMEITADASKALPSDTRALGFDYKQNIEGTNWSGKITSFLPSLPTATTTINIWKLKFEMALNLRVDLGFEIETTGRTNGRETAYIASITVPMIFFDFQSVYNLQAQFDDDVPMRIKGTIASDLTYTANLLKTPSISFKNPTTITELEVLNEADYNKDIHFYLGTYFYIHGTYLDIHFHVWFINIDFGPVLTMNLDQYGGCYFTARHEKDTFSNSDIGTAPMVHSCAKQGSPGCISLKIKEVKKTSFSGRIDLYFDDWDYHFGDTEEKTVAERESYNSLTFEDHFLSGPCPHKLYKVPVTVWMDVAMTERANGDCEVRATKYTAPDPIAATLATCWTLGGRASLYLAYQPNYRYTILAELEIGDARLRGSGIQPSDMVQGVNETVPIVLSQDEKVEIHIDYNLVADIQGKDRPKATRVGLQARNEATGTWQTVKTYLFNGQDGISADYTGPKYAIIDQSAYLIEYRAVVLGKNLEPVLENGSVIHAVNGFISVADVAERSDDGKFIVNYSSTQTDDKLTIRITETAAVDVTLNKQWILQNQQNKADSVWLALLQKPADGWNYTAASVSVPMEWIPALRPLSGNGSSLRDLMSAGILTGEDLYSVENAPLTIGKVSADNDWSITFTVPKYRSGIKMQFMGTELNSSVISDLLLYEYDVQKQVQVVPFGNFVTKPVMALKQFHEWDYSALIVNKDNDSHTISGTIQWVWYRDYDGLDFIMVKPNWVTITIYNPNGSWLHSFRINRSDYEIEDSSSDEFEYSTVWTWSYTDDRIVEGANYYVREDFGEWPGSIYNSPPWVAYYDGLDIVNYWTPPDRTSLYVQCIIEDPEDFQGEIQCNVLSNGVRQGSFALTPGNKFTQQYTFTSPLPNVSIETDNIDGWVRFYKEPTMYHSSVTGELCYAYTVVYLKQSFVEIDVSKRWDNVDDMTIYPDAVEAVVYRDGEPIRNVQLTYDGSEWSTAHITTTGAGDALYRLGYLGNDYHKFEYTIVEKPIQGFTSSVEAEYTTVSQSWAGSSNIHFTLVNTWAGADYVNLAGRVTWEGDQGKEYLRPEKVHIAVINSKEELVDSFDIPVNGDGTYKKELLPGRDQQGNPLSYSLLESHVTGYSTSYSHPSYDEDSRSWTVNVINRLTGYYPVTVKKTVEGNPTEGEEEYIFKVRPKAEGDSEGQEFPAPLTEELRITGAGETKAGFLIDEDGLYLYAIQEEKGENENCVYDEKEKQILILRTTDSDTGEVSFKSWVGEDGEDMIPTNGNTSDRVIFTNVYPTVTIEKEWDIDLEKHDRPDSIQVVVQKKSGDTWKTVKLVELSGDNDWKANIFVDGIGGDGAEFRVRELKEETALQELGGKLRDLINQGKDKYDEWLNRLKTEGKTYWDGLPEGIRNAADQGYDKLLDKLNATPQTLYDKLMEQLDFACAEGRIVYDEDDDEVKGKDGDDKPETNAVTYHVGAYASVLSGGTEDAHVTKYSVSYDRDGNTFTITNKAILEIDVIKRWITIGGEDVISLNGDDIPDSAWLVLMCKPKAGALDNAADLAGSLGVDLGSVLSYEFPVINPEEGGKDILTTLSELTIGVDVSIIGKLAEKIFGVKIPTVAMDKADEDSHWKATFVVSKYNMGIPMEYKGAELSSEVIRQIVKYITKVDIPVSFNPFDKYISIPTKAIRTFMGITDPGDLLDFSKLAGAALEKVKSLTMDDIKDFGPSTLLDDWHLMANVINIQITWDSEDDNTLRGAKIWKDDEEAKRPDTLTIHIKDGDKDIEGSPIELKKADFEGQDEWTWSLELPEDADEDATYVVSEEYPEDYEYKDDYTCETDGYDLINTWHKDRFTISGQKIWKDDEEENRPETITIRLLADGQEVASAVTSKAGEWKYSFPDQPKTKDGKAIVYTIAEDPVEGYKTSYDGYNVINTKVAEGKLVLHISRTAADAWKEQTFVFRIEGAQTEAVESGDQAGISLRVMVTLAPDATEGSVTVAGLPAGEYTVTEESDWSWRYNASISRAFSAEDPAASHGENALTAGKVRISSGMVTQAFFEAKRTAPYWLHNCGDDQAVK